MKKRAVIYARVSTRDKKQEPESQIMHLREVADLRGFDLVGVYFDKQSGARMDRKEYQAMRLAARRREFDVLLVWSYNRFARSAIELLMALEEFQTLGVDFYSHTQGLDTTTPVGRLHFTVLAGFAEYERGVIAENVSAGMARAKAQGKHVGRPPLPERKRRHIADLLRERQRSEKETPSKREIARRVGVGLTTVLNVERALMRL